MSEKKIPLIWQIGIGFVLGIVAGAMLGDKVQYVEPVGSAFLKLLKMLIVPLVFSSLVVGAASIGDPRDLGRIGLKTLFFYLATTAVAIVIGLVLGNLMQPGVGLAIGEGLKFEAKEAPSIKSVLLNLFPDNPLKAAVDGQMLQIIVFALFLGVSAVLAKDKGAPLVSFFDSMAETMYKLTGIVMMVAPYGVFALIADTVSKYGLSVLAPFAKVIIAVYVGCAAAADRLLIAHHDICRNPSLVLERHPRGGLTAFVTRSSAAAAGDHPERARTWGYRRR